MKTKSKVEMAKKHARIVEKILAASRKSGVALRRTDYPTCATGIEVGDVPAWYGNAYRAAFSKRHRVSANFSAGVEAGFEGWGYRVSHGTAPGTPERAQYDLGRAVGRAVWSRRKEGYKP